MNISDLDVPLRCSLSSHKQPLFSKDTGQRLAIRGVRRIHLFYVVIIPVSYQLVVSWL